MSRCYPGDINEIELIVFQLVGGVLQERIQE